MHRLVSISPALFFFTIVALMIVVEILLHDYLDAALTFTFATVGYFLGRYWPETL